MATWARIKMFWSTMLGSTGSTLAASSTATGDYDVDYLYNMLAGNMWKAANGTVPMYLELDLGAGNTAEADYIVVHGHNLKTINAALTLQYSSNGSYTGDTNNVFLNQAPASDGVYLKEFTSPGAFRYWRLRISEATGGGTLSPTPYMTLCIWGLKTELDYASSSFDPYEQEAQATVNRSYGGQVAGFHTKYIDRRLAFTIEDADSTLYDKVKTWWDTHGMKQLFIAWETVNSPTDIWLMYPDSQFRNPLNMGGTYRTINLSFKGAV